MVAAITWGMVGLFVLFLGIGLTAGLIRGIKRSAVHFAFFFVSILLAFFITKPVTNAILGIRLSINGGSYTVSEYLIEAISKMINADISQFSSASQLIQKLPVALMSPILFIVLALICYAVFDVIYLIFARLVFGKKKKSFQKEKPYRSFGGAIGIVEGFMFIVLLFAPITALTNTFGQISQLSASATVAAEVEAEEEKNNEHLQTIPELINDKLPKQITEVINAYNNSVVGKISGVAGIDDLMFDSFSEINVSGQNIKIRKELISATRIYNSFANAYNSVVDKDYENLNIGTMKKDVDDFLSGGLFKAVVVDTAKQFILNHTDYEFTKKLPQIAQDIIDDLKTKLTENEDISFADYLKNDILNAADAASYLINTGIVNDYMNLKDKTAIGVLEFIDANSTIAKRVLDDVLELNIIKDSLPTLLGFGSEQFSKAFDNNPKIKLNTEISDPEEIQKLFDDAQVVLPNFLRISKLLDIPSLIKAKDKIQALADNQNLTELFNLQDENGNNLLGATFDGLRELKVLKFEDYYVLDEILKNYDVEVLGDTVYEYDFETETATKKELKTYTDFFTHIKTPILAAKDLIGKSDMLSEALNKLKADDKFLAISILPFKGMNAFDLNKMVFEEVKTSLSDTEMISFEHITEEDPALNYKKWNEEFVKLGQILNNLNKGKIESLGNKTYIEYILNDDYNQQTLFDALAADENFATTFDPIFKSEMFKPMSQKFITEIDNQINELTKLNANETVYENLLTDVNATKTIQDLLKVVKNVSTDNIEVIGQILESLKQDVAASDNALFKNIFAKLIWYLTGDNIEKLTIAEGATPFEKSADIKKYLGIQGTGEGAKEEYLQIDYTQKFYKELLDDIDTAVKLGNSILGEMNNLGSENDPQKFVDALKTATTTYSDDDIVKSLKTMSEFIDKNAIEEKLPSVEKSLIESTLKSTFSETVAEAFSEFLGLNSEV